MDERGIVVTKKFQKDFKKIEKSAQKKSWNLIIFLKSDIFSDQCDIKKIKGHNNLWRLRIGKYRLFYSFNEEDIILLRIVHRKDAYKSNIEEG